MKLYSSFIKPVIFGFYFILFMNHPVWLFGQPLLQRGMDDAPYFFKKQFFERNFKPNRIVKATSYYTEKDWAAIINTTWGPGLPIDQSLQILFNFSNTIDAEFACFQDLDVNWDSLMTVYFLEVSNGVSRGRFAAIMNHLALALKESHTNIQDKLVNWNTTLAPGVPLLVVGGWGENGHFGAGLTPLPDSSLLVYKVVPNHPLHLVPGDIVLGYDNVPWKVLYKELLAAQLPIYGWWWGCSESAYVHSWLMSAGMNWHLFDTIDIVKNSTRDTVHLSTTPLIDKSMRLFCTEQMNIPGVPMPNYSAQQLFSYGIIKGTTIGYIYGWGWFWNAEQEFLNAVKTLMFNYQTTGLVIDFRMNYGGNMFLSNSALSILFNSTVSTIGFAERSDPLDHFAMRPSLDSPPSAYIIHGDTATYYNKPIAVLTGPGAVSSGDQVALRMRFHPMVRVFGKSTSAAFNAPTQLDLGNSDWYSRYAKYDAYLVSHPDLYLTHDEFEVDEDVWLTPDDVAQGHDTVVKAALEWIQNYYYAHDVTINPIYANPGIDTLSITAILENPKNHNLSVLAILKNKDDVVIDSISLFDDASHNDGFVGDGIWGGFWPVSAGELQYFIDIQTTDIDSGIFRLLKNAATFTTIGPVILEEYVISIGDTLPNPGDNFGLRLTLKNKGLSAIASNITTKLSSPDICVLVQSGGSLVYGDIAPGETSTTSGFYWVKLATNCQAGTDIPFVVDIASENSTFWCDTFFVYVYPTSIADAEKNIPVKFELNQNFPNPFNPTTTIEFSLPKSGFVTLKVYNLLGEEVATLIAEQRVAGIHKLNWDARGLASGVYMYRLKAGEFVNVKKLILMH